MIETEMGTFKVQENGKGCILSMEGKKIFELPGTAWWNTDAILEGIARNRELIEKNISERL